MDTPMGTTFTAFTAEEKKDFVTTLSQFMKALQKILSVCLEMEDEQKMQEWVNKICEELNGDSFLKSVCDELMGNDMRSENEKMIIDLLTLELEAVTEYMVHCNDENRLFRGEPVSHKKGIKAGGIVLDSIKDLLGKDAPYWLKSLFTIGKECTDVLTGA